MFIYLFILYYSLIIKYILSYRIIKCNLILLHNNNPKLYSRRFAECIVEFDDLDKVSIDNPKDYKPSELRNMPIEELEKTITNTRRIVKKMELVRKNNPMEFVKSNYNIVRKLLARSLFIRHEIELNRRRNEANNNSTNNISTNTMSST